MKELMELMNLEAASGDENIVRSYLLKKITPHCKDIKVDKSGNLIVHKKGKGSSVMLVAHMDEIGLMIKSIEKEGIIHVAFLGDIDPITCIGQEVEISINKKKKIRGVVSTIKINAGEDMEALPKEEDIIVDTGLTKAELKKKGVDIGSFLEFNRKSTFLGSENIIAGKAVDDRVGCFILLEIIRRTKKCAADIYYVFTVQEELGMYGAKTSVYNINPEWAVILDTTEAKDFTEETNLLGAGPVLTIMDSDQLTDSRLNKHIENIAKKKRIPLQKEVNEINTSDALFISLAKGGIPVAVLNLPVRNLHTAISILHTKDITNLCSLLEALLKNSPRIK